MSKANVFSTIGCLCAIGAMAAWSWAGYEAAHENIVGYLTDGATYKFKVNGMIWELLPPKNEG